MQSINLLGLTGITTSSTAVLTEDGSHVSYAEMSRFVDEMKRCLDWPSKALVVCRVTRNLESVLVYLATLALGHAVLLIEDGNDLGFREIVNLYSPELVVDARGRSMTCALLEGYARPIEVPNLVVLQRLDREAAPEAIHPETALLLRTSGSLSAPKTVRLSFDNLLSNALSVSESLAIAAADRGVTSLPLDFSFGLSVVNSHLVSGASLVVAGDSPTSRRFWSRLARARCTSVSAVPVSYRLLHARGWDPSPYPSLRLLCQAGGALDTTLVRYFGERMLGSGGGFAVMYGQTEATARMTCLPPGQVLDRLGSVGPPIPRGRIWIEDDAGSPLSQGEVGEVTYAGPNVMMGYASARPDLAYGDLVGGVLRTGDLGYLKDGYLYLQGRKDRVVKVLGKRISLDEVERTLSPFGDVAVVPSSGEGLIAFVERDRSRLEPQRREAAKRLGIPLGMLEIAVVDRLPRGPRGKINYHSLRDRAGHPTLARCPQADLSSADG